jgi:hypothetical protein
MTNPTTNIQDLLAIKGKSHRCKMRHSGVIDLVRRWLVKNYGV